MKPTTKAIILPALVLLGVVSALPCQASLPASSIGTIRTTAKNDPVQILSCDGAFQNTSRSWFEVKTLAFNRYKYDLVEYDVHYRFFDQAHHIVFEQTSGYSADLGGDALDVAPGDQTAGTYSVPNTADNINLITSLDCKVESAKFADSSTWKSGSPWHGKVYYTPPASSSASPVGSNDLSQDNDSQSNYTKLAGLKATVLATWRSVVSGDQWVHIRFALSANKRSVLRPNDFVATVNLEAGGTKTYDALTEPAPLLPKAGLASMTINAPTVPAVAASEDLGSMGSVVVAPGSPTTVVVTFHVPEELSPSRPVQSIEVTAEPN